MMAKYFYQKYVIVSTPDDGFVMPIAKDLVNGLNLQIVEL